MTAVDELTDDPASLVSSVLDEEAKRQAAQAASDTDLIVLPDDLLPGVGGEEMSHGRVVAAGGATTLGVLLALGFADNLINISAFQVLAPDIRKTFGLSDGAIGVIGALPAIALGVIVLFVRDPVRGRYEQMAVLGEELVEGGEPPISIGAAFARLKKIRSFYYLMSALGAFGMAVTTVPLYLNLILKDHLHMGAGERGAVGSITFVGAVIGAVIGGRYADVLFRRSPELTMKFAGGAL